VRALRIAEDLFVLASAGLLAVWAFSSRSAKWNIPLGVAIALLAAILIRRLAGWVRAKPDGGDREP
jgi:hypothetical protein